MTMVTADTSEDESSSSVDSGPDNEAENYYPSIVRDSIKEGGGPYYAVRVVFQSDRLRRKYINKLQFLKYQGGLIKMWLQGKFDGSTFFYHTDAMQCSHAWLEQVEELRAEYGDKPFLMVMRFLVHWHQERTGVEKTAFGPHLGVKITPNSTRHSRATLQTVRLNQSGI